MLLRDKNIVIIDDSIVRGTTMKQLIEMLRSAGAKAVHVRYQFTAIFISMLLWHGCSYIKAAYSIASFK